MTPEPTIAEIKERLKRVPRDMEELNELNRDFVLNAPEDIAMLLAALKKYGRHHRGCIKHEFAFPQTFRPCTCGWDALMKTEEGDG